MRSSQSPSISRPAGQVPLYALALFLTLSGLLHMALLIASGASWAGSVSLRKPIVFGLSAGLTAFSLAWILGKFKQRWRLDGLLSWLMIISLGGEVGLITLQYSRGEPSHFNHATPLDHTIAVTMDALITVATLVVVVFALRAFGELNMEPAMALAIRAGLLYLVVACGLGYMVSFIGAGRAAHGLPTEYYGDRGVLKFPHGMPLHALQWFTLLAWLAVKAGWHERNRVAIIWAAVVGQALLTVFSLLQTFSGRGRGQVTTLTAALMVLGLLLMLGPPLVTSVVWLARLAVQRR